MHHIIFGHCFSEDEHYTILGKEIDGWTLIHQLIPNWIKNNNSSLTTQQYGKNRLSLLGLCVVIEHIKYIEHEYAIEIPDDFDVYRNIKESHVQEYKNLLKDLGLDYLKYEPKLMILCNCI